MSRPLAVVIRFTALGDVLLTAPLVEEVARTHDVAFVTEAAYAPLVGRLAGVTQVHVLRRKDGVKGAWALGRTLAALKPALVLDLQHKVRSLALAAAIHAPDTRTLRRRTTAQALGVLVGQDKVHDDEHQVARYLRLVGGGAARPLGPCSPAPEWIAEAARITREHGWADDARPIAIAPAATHATKGWEIERHATIALKAAPRGSPLLLVAGPSDREAVAKFKKILGEHPGLLDTSALPLTTLAALLARARVLVGNDSGPIHLATMLGVPTVAIFGPTSRVRWGPVPGTERRHRVAHLPIACSPCSNHGGPVCPRRHHGCMEELSIDAVEREVIAALAP